MEMFDGKIHENPCAKCRLSINEQLSKKMLEIPVPIYSMFVQAAENDSLGWNPRSPISPLFEA
jgi:hypothetical protein